MKKISSLFIMVALSMAIFLCPNTQAALIDQTFYTQVTDVDDPAFWGWNVGDYIAGHAIYDDANIPQTGEFTITRSTSSGVPVPDTGPSEHQQFQLSIDMGNGLIITELDDLDVNFGFPCIQFFDGELSGFEWKVSTGNAIDYFAYSGDSFFVRGGPTGGTLSGRLSSSGPDPDPTPTPEPATLLLLGTGLVGFFQMNRKKKK